MPASSKPATGPRGGCLVILALVVVLWVLLWEWTHGGGRARLAMVSAAAALLILLALWVHHRVVWPGTFPHRARRVMVELGLVGRGGEPPRLARKRRQRASHPLPLGRRLRRWLRPPVWHLQWRAPAGVTVARVQAVQDAIEEHLDCSLRVWVDRGMLHTSLGRGRLPDVHELAAVAHEPAPGDLVVHLGQSREGPLDCDLTRPPHTLIGGTSGGGKTALVQSIVLQLARRYGPDALNLVLIDLKGGVDMAVFERLPHLRWPPAGDPDEAAAQLADLVAEQKRRQAELRGHAKDLASWNRRYPDRRRPYIVAVVDEFAELLPKDAARGPERDAREAAWAAVSSLARMGRASGIHVILATQRPDHEVVTGQTRANCGRVVALQCATIWNSEVLLGAGHRAAAHLPERPGLAIYKLGGHETLVQLAYAEADDIALEIEELARRHGERPGLGSPAPEDALTGLPSRAPLPE